MKIKIINKMIAMMCAASISVSCVGTSVCAVPPKDESVQQVAEIKGEDSKEEVEKNEKKEEGQGRLNKARNLRKLLRKKKEEEEQQNPEYLKQLEEKKKEEEEKKKEEQKKEEEQLKLKIKEDKNNLAHVIVKNQGKKEEELTEEEKMEIAQAKRNMLANILVDLKKQVENRNAKIDNGKLNPLQEQKKLEEKNKLEKEKEKKEQEKLEKEKKEKLEEDLKKEKDSKKRAEIIKEIVGNQGFDRDQFLRKRDELQKIREEKKKKAKDPEHIKQMQEEKLKKEKEKEKKVNDAYNYAWESYVSLSRALNAWAKFNNVNINMEQFSKEKASFDERYKLNKDGSIRQKNGFIDLVNNSMEKMQMFWEKQKRQLLSDTKKVFEQTLKRFESVQSNFKQIKNEKSVNENKSIEEKIEEILGNIAYFNSGEMRQSLVDLIGKEIDQLEFSVKNYKNDSIRKEYEKVLLAFDRQNRKFREWRDLNKINEDQYVWNNRHRVIDLFNNLRNSFDVKNAQEFIKSAKEAMLMMDNFEKLMNECKVEQERQNKLNGLNVLAKLFEKHGEKYAFSAVKSKSNDVLKQKYNATFENLEAVTKKFKDWKSKQKSDISYYDNMIRDHRRQVNKLFISLKRSDFDVKLVEDYIKMAEKNIDMMNKLMSNQVSENNVNKVNNDVKKEVVNNYSSKKRLDDMYNKAQDFIERLKKDIFDFKNWLSKEHKIDLTGKDQRANTAKKIIDETNKLIKGAESEMGNGYVSEITARKVNLLLAKKVKKLKQEIKEFQKVNPAQK